MFRYTRMLSAPCLTKAMQDRYVPVVRKISIGLYIVAQQKCAHAYSKPAPAQYHGNAQKCAPAHFICGQLDLGKG